MNENPLLVNGRDTSERKRADKKLFESEKLYRSLFENMLNGFAYCQMHIDDNGRPIDFTYLSVNSAFETLTGLKDVVGKKVTEVIPGIRESDPELFEIYGRVSKTGKPERFEMFVDALKMWFLVSVYSPERGYFVAVFDVITERKKAESALIESKNTLSNLISNLPGYIYRVANDPDYTPLFISEKVGLVTGYAQKEYLVDRTISCGKEIHPEDADKVWQIVQQAVEAKIPYKCEYRIITKQGHEKWVSEKGKGIFDEAEKLLYLEGYVNDITERKQAEEVIRESERLLNEAQHLAKIGNWYLDLVSGEVGWSKTLYEINKRDPNLSPPKYGELESYYTKESWERLNRAVEKAIKHGAPYDLELDIIRADGTIIQTHTYGKAIKDKSGRVVQLHGTVQDITERKLVEEAVKESEKKFRALYNETPVMMHSINQQGELLSVSDFWLEKLGYRREEVLGKNFTDFLTDSSKKHAVETILPQFKKVGHIENADYSFVKKNGEVIDCLVSAISQYDNNKNFIRSLAVITDITERKLAEETITKSEEKYRDIVENISDLICTHDMDGKILSANPAAVKLLGYKTDALLKMNIQDILSPDIKDQFSDYISALKKDGYAHGLMKVQTAAGNIRIWEYNNTLRTHGVETPVVRGLSKDITERMKIEAALRRSETNLRAIFENTNTGFLLLDTGFNIVSSNERGKELMNIAFGERSRKENNLYKMLPSERKQIFADQQSKVLQGGIVHYEVSYPQNERSVVWFDINCKPVKNDKDSVIGISFSITDITERKNSLDKLVKAESEIRNFARHLNHVIEEEKANIAREIHDELGQLLAGIKMGLSSLKKKQSPPTPRRGDPGVSANSPPSVELEGAVDCMMKDIDNSIQVMRKISTQLRPGILDSLGLIPSIQWLGSEFEKKTGVKCKLELNVTEERFEKNLSTCFFRICQESLTNISKHANASEVVIVISYSDSKGDVIPHPASGEESPHKISAHHKEISPPMNRGRNDNEQLTMRISDNGKGIASEKLENPFSMGLLGMRERANIIGADLQITSKKDFGTTIKLKAKLN
ncbi:MAG: PAS domain S-box protein [Bacteroidetes bacterium]|nr:PAS domain S-box protein [Bacteroidota bacterium]